MLPYYYNVSYVSVGVMCGMFPGEDKHDGLSAPDLLVCVVFVLVWQSLDYVIVPSFAKSHPLQSLLAVSSNSWVYCFSPMWASEKHQHWLSLLLPMPSILLLSIPFPCPFLFLFLFSLILILSLPLSFSPSKFPFTLWWKPGFFFPLMALSSSSAPYFVLAAPTLPRNLSAATGNSVHMRIYVLFIYGFCLFFVDIKLEMLAKVGLCLPHSRFISGGKKVQWLPGHLRVTLTAHCRLEI